MFLTLIRYTNGLKTMLDHYHNLMGTLSEAETKLLDDHIKELWRVFRSGHRRLNWNSLGNGDTTLEWPLLLICSSKILFNSAFYLICQIKAMHP